MSWVQVKLGCNFALHSKDAERVTLLLYADDPATPVLTDSRGYISTGEVLTEPIFKPASRPSRR